MVPWSLRWALNTFINCNQTTAQQIKTVGVILHQTWIRLPRGMVMRFVTQASSRKPPLLCRFGRIWRSFTRSNFRSLKDQGVRKVDITELECVHRRIYPWRNVSIQVSKLCSMLTRQRSVELTPLLKSIYIGLIIQTGSVSLSFCNIIP